MLGTHMRPLTPALFLCWAASSQEACARKEGRGKEVLVHEIL